MDYYNLTYFQGKFLENLISISNFKNILEVGTSNGISTKFLAKNLNEDCKITTIEINKEIFEKAKENLKQFENIIFLNDDFFNVELEGIFDFVFLDCEQKKYKKIVEKLFLNKVVNEKTIFICDNFISHKLIDFEKFVKKNFKFVEINKFGNGFISFWGKK